MGEDIKLPEPVAWIAEYGGDIYTADQVREAVRLNATVPEISTEHGPWVESNIHDGETYCKCYFVRPVFAGRWKYKPYIVSAPAPAPQPAAQQKGSGHA